MSWNDLFSLAFLATLIRSTTPLLLTALGGLFSERSGVVNIALEGLMIFGALAAAIATQLTDNSLGVWAPWFGWLMGLLVSGFIGWIHAVISIRYKADQIISGTAINLLAAGVPGVVLSYLYNSGRDSPEVDHPLPQWGIGDFHFSPPVYFAFLLVVLVWWLLNYTAFGLRLRATGEHHNASASMGINVPRMRYIAVIISGMLAGTAGVFLSIGNLSAFTQNLSAGLGFMALAALIFGKWDPVHTLMATILFGFLRALAIEIGGHDLMPSSVVDLIPYASTILALALIGHSVAPKDLGKPYDG